MNSGFGEEDESVVQMVGSVMREPMAGVVRSICRLNKLKIAM